MGNNELFITYICDKLKDDVNKSLTEQEEKDLVEGIKIYFSEDRKISGSNRCSTGRCCCKQNFHDRYIKMGRDWQGTRGILREDKTVLHYCGGQKTCKSRYAGRG